MISSLIKSKIVVYEPERVILQNLLLFQYFQCCNCEYKDFKRNSLEILVLSKCFKLLGITFINIFFWFAVGTLRFTSNVVWENRPDYTNLERAIIPERLYEISMSRMQQKREFSELKKRLVCGFKNIGYERVLSIEIGLGKLLLVKCSQEFID